MSTTLEYATMDAWEVFERDDARFRRILAVVAAPFLALCILIPLYELSTLAEGGGDEISDRFAELLLEQAAQQEVQATPAPAVEPEPEPEPEPATDPEPEPEPKPDPKPEPAPEVKATPPPKPTPPPVDRSVEARKKVQKQLSGALSALQSLSQTPVVSANQRPLRQAQTTQTDISSASVVTSNVGGGSGARVRDVAPRDSGRQTQLGPRQGSNVNNTITASGGGIGKASDRSGFGGQSRLAGRSLEEIQLVMDRNKGGLYSIYNRALRKNPALAGKLVLRITIAPSGQVTQCEVVSSELRDPDLERKVVSRVRLIQFGAKDVDSISINYPIYFAPS